MLTDRSPSPRLLRAALIAHLPLAACMSTTAKTERLQETGAVHQHNLELLEAEHRSAPEDVGVRIALAQAYSDAGRAEEGAALLLQEPAEQAEPVELSVLRSAVMIDPVGERTEATARHLLNEDPTSVHGYLGLLHGLRVQGKHAEFQAQALRWSEFSPFGDVATNIAYTLMRGHAAASNVREAIAWSERLIRIRAAERGSVYWEDVLWLSHLYEGSERWPGAAERLRSLVAVPEGGRPELIFDIALPDLPDADRSRPIDTRAELGFSLAGDGSRVVSAVAPKGLGAAAGLQAGETILSVDGAVPPQGFDPAHTILDVPAGVEVAIRVASVQSTALTRRGTPPSAWQVLQEALAEMGRTASIEDQKERATAARVAADGLGVTASPAHVRAAVLWKGFDIVWKEDPATNTPERRVNKALHELDAILAENPWLSYALNEKAEVLVFLKRYDEAFAVVEELKARHPEKGFYVAYEGLLHLCAKLSQRANSSFHRAVTLGKGGDTLESLARILDKRQAQQNSSLARAFFSGVAMGLVSAAAGARSSDTGSVGWTHVNNNTQSLMNSNR